HTDQGGSRPGPAHDPQRQALFPRPPGKIARKKTAGKGVACAGGVDGLDLERLTGKPQVFSGYEPRVKFTPRHGRHGACLAKYSAHLTTSPARDRLGLLFV